MCITSPEHLNLTKGNKLNFKTCPKCKKESSINDFSKNKTTKDGLNGWCKECIKFYINYF